MRSSRDAMLALTDAMIFCVLIVAALGVTAAAFTEPGPEQDNTASDVLDALISSQVRMSDMVDGGDGSLVRVSDLCALHVRDRVPGVEYYLEDAMEVFTAGMGYTLTIEYDGAEAVLGDGDGDPSTVAVREVPVTTGGVVRMTLCFYAS